MTGSAQKRFSFLLIVSAMIVLWMRPALGQKYTAEFLNIGIGARALGMGGAYVAISNDGTSVYWNPAGLARLDKREISLMHASHFSGLIQTNFIGFVCPDNNGNTFGISFFRLGIDGIPKSTKLDEFDRPIIEGYLEDSEHALFLSFARKATESLTIGGNLKAIYQKTGENSSMGFGFDLGASLWLSSNIKLGLHLQDLAGTHVFWDTGQREVRLPTLTWGAAFTPNLNFILGKITIAASQNIRFEGENSENVFSLGEFAGSDFNAGAEWRILNTIALRTGLNRRNLSAGAGIQFRHFDIDYAFVSYDLGNTHRVSGRILF